MSKATETMVSLSINLLLMHLSSHPNCRKLDGAIRKAHRRVSDLRSERVFQTELDDSWILCIEHHSKCRSIRLRVVGILEVRLVRQIEELSRSEEHTSEIQ